MLIESIFIIVLYSSATIQEWCFHRFMHMNNHGRIQKDHMNHHKHTNHQYIVELRYSDYICFDIRHIQDILQFIGFWTLNTSVLYLLFTPYISFYICSFSCFCLLVYNMSVWNTYHAYIHGLCASEICFMKGLPYSYVPTTNVYSSWIIRNHQLHHKYPTKNFNIVFPGADYMFCTYVDER